MSGGTANFILDDPRGTGAYFAADDPAGRLIVELDAAQTGGWGDAGVAHLFGDPGALSSDDLASLRYHWDCS